MKACRILRHWLLPVSEAGCGEGSAVRSVHLSGALGDSVKIGTSDSLQAAESLAVEPFGVWSSDLLLQVLGDESTTCVTGAYLGF